MTVVDLDELLRLREAACEHQICGDVAELVRAARDARQYMGGKAGEDKLGWVGVIRALDAALEPFRSIP